MASKAMWRKRLRGSSARDEQREIEAQQSGELIRVDVDNCATSLRSHRENRRICWLKTTCTSMHRVCDEQLIGMMRGRLANIHIPVHFERRETYRFGNAAHMHQRGF